MMIVMMIINDYNDEIDGDKDNNNDEGGKEEMYIR